MADYLTEALVHGRRPSKHSNDPDERRLGHALCNYTSIRHSVSSYDPVFDKKIRKLRPDWFENTATGNKEKLIKMAGEKRPNSVAKDKEERKLGQCLISYTCKHYSSYDPIFDRKIRKLIPDWFENTATKKKETLFKLVKSGAKRPSLHSKNEEERKLGWALVSYTNKSKGCYDPDFNKKIRKLGPDWFESTADINKAKLLKLARSGAKRPNKRTNKLGGVLGNYTNKNQECYDPVFDKKIRELRPDWFENTSDLNKEKLLKLAKSGAKRPNDRAKDEEEGKLGHAIYNYTGKKSKSYDPVFDRKVRQLRPDWFRRK